MPGEFWQNLSQLRPLSVRFRKNGPSVGKVDQLWRPNGVLARTRVLLLRPPTWPRCGPGGVPVVLRSLPRPVGIITPSFTPPILPQPPHRQIAPAASFETPKPMLENYCRKVSGRLGRMGRFGQTLDRNRPTLGKHEPNSPVQHLPAKASDLPRNPLVGQVCVNRSKTCDVGSQALDLGKHRSRRHGA